jgi:hypothetical protein
MSTPVPPSLFFLHAVHLPTRFFPACALVPSFVQAQLDAVNLEKATVATGPELLSRLAALMGASRNQQTAFNRLRRLSGSSSSSVALAGFHVALKNLQLFAVPAAVDDCFQVRLRIACLRACVPACPRASAACVRDAVGVVGVHVCWVEVGVGGRVVVEVVSDVHRQSSTTY